MAPRAGTRARRAPAAARAAAGTLELPGFAAPALPAVEAIAPGAVLLRGAARAEAAALLAAIADVAAAAPWRHMQTPMGAPMSAAMTNCGPLGWTADEQGYRYSAVDPLSGRPWPAIPPVVLDLARATAARAGYPGFTPDACLINRYAAGARMGLHRDADEPDERAPIVSVSLGLPARLQWGGLRRRDPTQTWTLEHGDVLVFGGPSRRAFHGIRPIAPGEHPATGALRFNLTLRRAGAA